MSPQSELKYEWRVIHSEMPLTVTPNARYGDSSRWIASGLPFGHNSAGHAVTAFMAATALRLLSVGNMASAMKIPGSALCNLPVLFFNVRFREACVNPREAYFCRK